MFSCLSGLTNDDGPVGVPGGVGACGIVLTGFSWLLIAVTLPFSLFVCFKVPGEGGEWGPLCPSHKDGRRIRQRRGEQDKRIRLKWKGGGDRGGKRRRRRV